MMKKIIALLVCALMLVTVFAGCSSEINDENKGAYIQMYISDPVYNFDPARAYNNESALKVISLVFDNLFILGDDGKVEKSLAKDYEIIEDKKNNEYKMVITLNSTFWSDGVALTAEDVVFAWKRILDPSNSFDAASLLYDIEYAREAKLGEKSIDDVKIYATGTEEIEIKFVGKIDYDAFLLKLTSYALAPLRENLVTQVESDFDWAKKPTLFTASGPFKLREAVYDTNAEAAGFVFERNERYRRKTTDDLDEYVTPYKLVVDYTMDDKKIMEAYKNGELFFVGDIPLALRGEWKEEAEIAKNAFSTHTYMLNHNKVIRYYNEEDFLSLKNANSLNKVLEDGKDGEKIFANKAVRQALSMAINRDELVKTAVFAEAATGIVPTGVFNTTSKKTSFREKADASMIKSNALAEAKKLLVNSGIDASKYMFSISVAAYDDVHMAIAKKVQENWNALGFHVEICALDVVDNTHVDNTTNSAIIGIKDDIFAENYEAGKFDVAAIDYTAYSVDAFSVLAPFAKTFNGGAATSADSPDFNIPTHLTGYNSDAYNKKIEEAYKETNAKKKAELLHAAEKILMDDMAIIPLIFNKSATLTSKELSKDKVTYYNTPIFTKLKLRDYEKYVPVEQSETVASKDKTEGN